MKLALERPDQPEVAALIDALDAYQRPLYPPESHHGITIAALLRPEVLFAVLRDEAGAAIGCGAVVLGEGLGELKRMFVVPAQRGRGHSRQLLGFLEDQAALRGCTGLALETGTKQAEALGLYERAGYRRSGPFGAYAEDPHSVFMHKPIAAAPLRAQIGAFLDDYRAAFDRLDGEAVARLYAVPSGIVDAQRYTHWADFAAIHANMAALCRLYREHGYRRAGFAIGALLEQGDRFAIVDVAWTIEREPPHEAWRFSTTYNLVRSVPGWRVLLCTAYSEARLSAAPR